MNETDQMIENSNKEELQQKEIGMSIETIEPLLDNRIIRAIRDMGFEKLSPIQEMSIPKLLEGKDIIGQAQTGTGKTAAFGIPLLSRVNPDLRKLQAIVLCPTRELAIQAAEELRKLAKYMQGIKVLPVYGGQEIGRQIIGLRGVQIIVGTPGRVMDHMRRHTIKLGEVKMVVLDEADEMLNMGFREDMELILGQIENEHQTALFSATMPQPILDITHKFQKDAELVKVAAKELTIPLVSQKYYRIKSQDKDAATVRLLEYYQPKLCLVFCNTKVKVDEVAEMLKKHGFQAEGLHGDMSQHQRDVAMGRFRNGSTNILIATDVAARGIDVDNVEAVINYDVPQDIEYYVHRIGRTGRAGKTGRSFTFVTAKEIFRIREIEKFCKTHVEEKKLPGASKVLKAKSDKYLDVAWELHEHEDMDLMKSYLQERMEKEGCDALELAAAMLKYQVGDRGDEILEDKPIRREENGRRRFDQKGRDGRGHGIDRKFFGRDEKDGEKKSYGRGNKDGEKRISGRGEKDDEKKAFGRRNKDGDRRFSDRKNREDGTEKFRNDRKTSERKERNTDKPAHEEKNNRRKKGEDRWEKYTKDVRLNGEPKVKKKDSFIKTRKVDWNA